MKHRAAVAFAVAAICAFALTAQAHHSFAMYDPDKTYVITGVVVRVDPNPNHLQIFFVPLNEARDQIIRDGLYDSLTPAWLSRVLSQNLRLLPVRFVRRRIWSKLSRFRRQGADLPALSRSEPLRTSAHVVITPADGTALRIPSVVVVRKLFVIRTGD